MSLAEIKEELEFIPIGDSPQNLLRSAYNRIRQEELGKDSQAPPSRALKRAIQEVKKEYADFIPILISSSPFFSELEEEVFDLSTYQPLPVVYELRASILKRIERGEEVIPDVDGREETKADVIRALLSGAHPYLVSEEGTGKTRLARSLTKLLPPIPIIKGCPYNDDPKWAPNRLCPRCRESVDPVQEFGVELIPGERRFSRIQGNEYTNEAKLLGLKDIQAIAQGRSPSDPQVFTGTGVFRANRGVLFIDELPAIRTKVQVLLHPILEEKKAILEEYNWEHPLDLVLVATGNPQGFAHVNEVPRPLLDRLELIYMDLPTEEVERDIMLMERFRVALAPSPEAPPLEPFPKIDLQELKRKVVAPWWILYLVNKAVRRSRICPWLDKKASIRGTSRGIDHTYASVELENKRVANLKHACEGLKLALRSRIALRVDLIDFESPGETFSKSNEIVEDLLWNAIEDLAQDFYEFDAEKLAEELILFLSRDTERVSERLRGLEELRGLVDRMKRDAKEKVKGELLNEIERELFNHPERAEQGLLDEYIYSALETVINIAIHRKLIDESVVRGKFFIPQMVSWARRR